MNSNHIEKKLNITDPEILEDLVINKPQDVVIPTVNVPVKPTSNPIPKPQAVDITRDSTDTRPGLSAYKPVILKQGKNNGV
ncbi:hypothetical protein QKU48_gp1317 [Fadolivirus algeromassiliense]|jgi:hypothetical protein|uniref:Uncharacterized protein n=1 Tax=Fadolivirus FV1/VV64 TaxID=3070911 RepID=A0A7D3V628_9VIRU|nr:hypothetical protein QKU48_gp1317 [Fadolivirus algeromassiliense]QKF94775.1 hypothetical protein Fadolivirus_1_1317 [Fadolivirus FV1/VV64]